MIGQKPEQMILEKRILCDKGIPKSDPVVNPASDV